MPTPPNQPSGDRGQRDDQIVALGLFGHEEQRIYEDRHINALIVEQEAHQQRIEQQEARLFKLEQRFADGFALTRQGISEVVLPLEGRLRALEERLMIVLQEMDRWRPEQAAVAEKRQRPSEEEHAKQLQRLEVLEMSNTQLLDQQGKLEKRMETMGLGVEPTLGELKELRHSFELLQTNVATLQEGMHAVEDPHDFELLQTNVATNQADGSSVSRDKSLEAAGQDESFASGRCFNPHLEYSLGGSIWDTALILGMQEVGLRCSLFLGFVFAMNMFIQMFMIYVLLDPKMGFNDVDTFPALLAHMTHWRYTDAHDDSLEDPNGVNLVNRVCNIDEALSLASLQVQSLKEINSYLDLELADLELITGFLPGPVLCMVCTMILTVLICLEIRQNMYFLLCISDLPRRHTEVQYGEFVAVSSPRFTCILVLTCIRLGISFSLLYSGIVWLSSTSSMSDLLLNAAALGFVLQIDEVLFNSIVPHQVITLVERAKPLRFKKDMHQIDAVAPVLFSAVTLVYGYSQHVLPNFLTMLDIKNAMCGPSQQSLNFVVKGGFGGTGVILSKYSTPFEDAGVHDGSSESTPLARAIDELRDHSSMVIPGHQWGDLTYRLERNQKVPIESLWSSEAIFDSQSARDLSDLSSIINSACSDIFRPYEDRDLVYVQERIRRFAGIHEALSPATIYSPLFFRCSDFAGLCDVPWNAEASFLRMLCPQMCGCDNPWSGLWLGAPRSYAGCPGPCGYIRDRRFNMGACTDFNVEEAMAVLIAQDSSYARLMNATLGDGLSPFFDLTEAHLLDLIGTRLGKEFQTTVEAFSYIAPEYDSSLDTPNDKLDVAGPSNLILLTWTRYWKNLMLNVPNVSWNDGLDMFMSCEVAVQAKSIFDDLQFPWSPCAETEEMAMEVGGTSLKAFCPAACYALALQDPARLDRAEFRMCLGS